MQFTDSQFRNFLTNLIRAIDCGRRFRRVLEGLHAFQLRSMVRGLPPIVSMPPVANFSPLICRPALRRRGFNCLSGRGSGCCWLNPGLLVWVCRLGLGALRTEEVDRQTNQNDHE